MSNEISWLLVVEILPGQLIQFRDVVNDLVASTEKEPGTLSYQWHLSEDDTVCHIVERYANSVALITHVQSFHNFAERFLKTCKPVRFDVYGNPNAEARAMLAALKPIYFPHLAGFSR
jgi:quinol monooxygenase YgiN